MPGGPEPYKHGNQARRTERVQLIFDLKIQGLSFHAIEALSLDPNGPTGGERIPWTTARDLFRGEIANRVDPRVDEYRALELARLEAALDRLNNMAESVREVMARKHITINNGQVIRVLNAETGEKETVEDDTFVLQAIDRLGRIEEQRRKTSDSICRLLGLNAPTRVESTVTETSREDIALQELVAEMRAKNIVTVDQLHAEREQGE